MNDERPIEKLLRRFAKKRRDEAGAPVEMHPATRRLLQGEVASQLQTQKTKDKKVGPRDEGRSFLSFAFLTHNLSRLAWAVSIFVLIAVGFWSWPDRPKTKQLALGSRPSQMATESLAKRERADNRSAAPESLPAIVVQTAPADFSAANAKLPSPAAAPVGSLNQPAPRLADRESSSPSRVSPALAFGGTTGQSATSLASGEELKRDSARFGFKDKETAAADKLGVVPVATPAPLVNTAEAASRSHPQQLDASTARSFAANPVNSREAATKNGSDGTLQLDPMPTGAAAAKASEPGAPALDSLTAPTTLARNGILAVDRAQTYAQSYTNRAPESFKQKAVPALSPVTLSPVLANFRVEQTGRQLRVVDGDGSTYLGETDTALEVWAGRAAANAEAGNASAAYVVASGGGKKEQVVQLFQSDGKLNLLPAEAKSIAEQPMQNNFYRVTGTNRTLNQAVVFTWSFVELTNAPGFALSGNIGGERNQDAKKLPAQFPLPRQNSFINGRAQFGTGQEIEIHAVPVTP